MRRLIRIVFFMFMVAAVGTVCHAEENVRQDHNTILIIDNSLSTTGSHSLGSATDPNGLRFDAARLVYDNVLSSAQAGTQGEIGVLIFCGPENCMVYGPMNIDADPAALNEAVGQYLNEAANQNHRDNYTDIRTALEKAKDMMQGFQGNTSIILLTDGVNDLTNKPDPFSQPENIEANDQSVRLVEEMKSLGADFSVIALTAQDAIQNTEAFMAFINRLAEAGGGVAAGQDDYSNVLVATQTDLGSKLLQMFVKTESETEAQITSQLSNEKWPFTVPYNGISTATVNITFMPEDKPKIRAIELIDPDGNVFTPFDNGSVQPVEGIVVTEDRSYVILEIPSPKPGEWSVGVTSAAEEEMTINTVVRFSHNLRLVFDLPETLYQNIPQQVRAWLQQYNGETYEDLKDSGFYSLSTATLTLRQTDGSGVEESIVMDAGGDCFTAEVGLGETGAWLAEIRIENPYYVEGAGDIFFEVVEAPAGMEGYPEDGTSGQSQIGGSLESETGSASTSAFTGGSSSEAGITEGDGGNGDNIANGAAADGTSANGTAADEASGRSATVETGTGKEHFTWKAEAEADGKSVSISWDGNGADGAEGELLAVGTDSPVVSGLHSGDFIDLSVLEENQEYTLMVAAFSGGADAPGTPPPMAQLDLQLIPDMDNMGSTMLNVAGAVIQLAPTVLSSDEAIKNAVGAAKELKEGLETVENLAVQGNKGADGEAAQGMTDIPEGSDTVGVPDDESTADDGISDGQDDQKTTGGQDDENASDQKGRSEKSKSQSQKSSADAVESPEPPDASEENNGGNAISGFFGNLESNWIYLAAGGAVLVVLLAVLLLSRGKGGKKVYGTLKITCDAIRLETILKFEGRSQIQEGQPLTRHPDIAKLKNSKIYDVLSHIQASMTEADGHGMIEGSEIPHMPKEKVITLTYAEPGQSEPQVCHVGRNDGTDSVLNVRDAGRIYEVHFTGKLDFDEMMAVHSGNRR